jgi:hypothetical protein
MLRKAAAVENAAAANRPNGGIRIEFKLQNVPQARSVEIFIWQPFLNEF